MDTTNSGAHPKVLITAKVHDYLREQLSRRGFDVIYNKAVTYDEVTDIIADVTGLIGISQLGTDLEARHATGEFIRKITFHFEQCFA